MKWWAAGIFVVAMGCSGPAAKESDGGKNDGGANDGGANDGGANNGGSNNGGSNNLGEPGELRSADFDQGCTYDRDCSLVYEGTNVCDCRQTCPNSAISATDSNAWDTAWENACPDGEAGLCSLAPCRVLTAACGSDGQCHAAESVFVDASEWDKSCSSDSDCVIVHEGDVCARCICGGTPVNVSEEPKYREALESIDCNPGPSDCDCPLASDAWCDAGTCEVGTNPACTGIDGDGFFASCASCGEDCDSISTPNGTRSACGCSSSADCPCGLRCGDYEIAPNVTVGGICVR